MNRSFFAAATLLALFSVALRANQAHAQAFKKSSTSFASGLGLGNLFGSQSMYGPYHFKIEKGLTKYLSLGVSASLARNGYQHKLPVVNDALNEISDAANNESQNWAYGAVARLNLHIGKSKKFDPYVGAGLGYRSSNWNGTFDPIEFQGMNYYIPNTPIAYEFGIGARYYLLPFLGVYAELNAGKSPLQGGIIFNIPGSNKSGKGNGSGSGSGSGSGNGDNGGGGTVQGKNKGK
jgi:uncharacterized membrane protein YgcG